MDELEAFKIIDDAISGLDAPAKQRAIAWLLSKHGGLIPNAPPSPQPQHHVEPQTSQPVQAKSKPAKASKKVKVSVKMIKDLVLDKNGKSATNFVEKKRPTSTIEKSAVAVYYMLREIDLPTAGVDHVFTFFKYVGWPLPADPANTLQQAGSKGWLDTKLSADIKITPLGENLVEHKLPKAEAKTT